MITNTPLAYEHGDTKLEGLFVHDDKLTTPMPGILLIHEFTGLDDSMLPHAERLARQGYAVLLCDMYGKGIRPKDKAEASTQAHIYKKDRTLMRARAKAGLDALEVHPAVNRNRLFALGFSFGGCAALELARSGANLTGAISFYGYLNTPEPCRPGAVQGRLLVLHGAHDRVVPMSEIPIFEKEMHEADTDFRIIVLHDAGHGFANPTHENDPATGSWYCEEAAEKAWKTALEFLARN
ncbi:MAG: dienelactone hydrolase family protein [Pseudodesulfovibrio sp.]|nr:dienelactone hydrolase family protein [Pseudodesulfovibrio sp.]